jgi:hypothetical protein
MELLNQTIASLDLKYINEDQYVEIKNQIEKISNKRPYKVFQIPTL